MRNEEFGAGVPQEGLTEDQKKILDFAGRTYNHPGKQHEDILTEFGYRPTTFYRRLNDLLDNPHAAEYAPQTVNRHRRIVDAGLTKWGRQPRYSDEQA
jgi:hypothetical protein